MHQFAGNLYPRGDTLLYLEKAQGRETGEIGRDVGDGGNIF